MTADPPARPDEGRRFPTESDFRRAGLVFSCCSSCHEDEAEGYPISWIAEPGGPSESWPVCCSCANAFDELSDEAKLAMWTAALSPTPLPGASKDTR